MSGRYETPRHTTVGPRNRPMRADGYNRPPRSGIRRPDRRHNLAMDRTGCLILLLVMAPYFLMLLRELGIL